MYQLPCLCLLLLGANLPQQGKADPELDRARTLLASSEEGDVRSGADLCAQKNTLAAAELLLEVLRLEHPRGLAPAHYRDVAWDGLRRLSDPYARERVQTELAKNKESAWVRQWCAELLGEYRDGAFGASLEKALSDKDLGVQRAAARALGKLKYAPAEKALAKLVGHKDIYLRANAMEALARVAPLTQREVLLQGLSDKDGGVRCALLAVAAELYPDQAQQSSSLALRDSDWRARLQAVDNLNQIKTKEAVDGLILALDDARPIRRARAERGLAELTGVKQLNAEAWKAWWRDQREAFDFPSGRAKSDKAGAARTVAYHGIQVESDHIAFLIDRSGAMREMLTSRTQSKEQAALDELKAVFDKLVGQLVFNVMLYAEGVEAFSEKGPLELTETSSKKALEFVADSPMGAAKDIWQLLEQVVLDANVDTAFLLSSGEPDIGTYVHWNRVTWQLAEYNRFHKLVIHTIVFSKETWFREQLEKIAQVTGGEYTVID